MLESFTRLGNSLWVLLAGMVAGGLAALQWGPHFLWAVGAAAIVAFLAIRVLPLPVPVTRQVETLALDPLPPLARAVLEQLPAPVLLLDVNERVLFANGAMREVLGAGLERKHVSAVLRNPAVLAAIGGSFDSGEPGAAPFILPVPIERHYEAYTARVDGGMVALLLHNITAIRRSEQMRADFVANASHELRTPLAAVSGFIETLQGPARDDVAAREQFLGIMATEAARMRRLIDDLLSLTRIELNEHVPPQGKVALESVVRQAAAALAPLAAADRITVTVQGGADLPPIRGEHDELVQLFQNLIHNAIKYGREGGQVTVTLGRDFVGPNGGHIFAAVKDDGEGIPREALPRLTERFYRVDVKRSRERGGTGLGLAIVKHIVSRHHGRLAIDSRQGEGSTFSVILPLQPEEGAASGPQNPEKTASSAAVTELL
jgi:two-component system phosphate regulon sensor histidine kinase PhoR